MKAKLRYLYSAMIVRQRLDALMILRVTWKRITILLALSLIAVLAYHGTNRTIEIPDVPLSIFGTVIAILLGFRVNSAYERWWEARRIWGAVVNETRSAARQLVSFVHADYDVRRTLVYRHIAFAYALRDHLRPVGPHTGYVLRHHAHAAMTDQGATPFLSPDDREYIAPRNNKPNAILQRQGEHIAQLRALGAIDERQQMHLDEQLTELTDCLGACERIKRTEFPRDYSRYTSLIVDIFTFTFPFIIVDNASWQTIPWTMVLGFTLYSMDRVAYAIERPFENRINDTPMTAISRTIEIDLRQMLGETDVPKPVEAVDGYLF
jgi:putative membrane protein